MKQINGLLGNHTIRLVIYLAFFAGFYFMRLEALPEQTKKVNQHTTDIAVLQAVVEKIDRRTENIERILLRRGR